MVGCHASDLAVLTLSDASLIAELKQQNAQLNEQVVALQRQLDWFQRQLFGRKSEQRLEFDPVIQQDLLQVLGVPPAAVPAEPETKEIPGHKRRKARKPDDVNDIGLRFSDQVPVNTYYIGDPAIRQLPASEWEVIGEKVTWRLAQRPASYELMKYVREVYKLRDSGRIVATAAPPAVLDKCWADVSMLAGLMVDKFVFHLPLYRQHQRLQAAGISLSRATLAYWTSRAIDLLEPIFRAQAANVLKSAVLAMDETPIKAGRIAQGKMRQAYFWPIYGDADEIVFHYAPSRNHDHVTRLLGKDFAGTLLSDGYGAYDAYAKNNQAVKQAQCWAHTRRHFEEAGDADPQAVAEALALIGALYHHEQVIRDRDLEGEAKLAYRTENTEPIVKAFWQWCDVQCHRPEMTPTHPLAKALKYARERVAGLQVFLSDPDVPIDTNHLERALRPIPMGRRNWLFCWSELGARQVGIIQSLISTCKLHGVDPYTYLVDVLQRISVHPAKEVIDLTPRVWKTKFADAPLRSDIALADQ
jgi:transposase